jgi:cell division protein FtsB
MKTPLILLLALLSFSLSCSFADRPAGSTVAQKDVAQTAEAAKTQNYGTQMEKVSLNAVDKEGSTAEAADRKIIRNAEITIEVPSTTDAQHQVTSIAETHGGFVVTSEAKQRESNDPAQRTLDIKLVVRVPSNQFGRAFDEIKKLAANTPAEQVSSQDVTEDFIDLEARIKTQKALEVQFLEIMRQAQGIAEALEVQRQIAEVRTEIEKLEGRKRFLENRSSLSTINVNIQTPKPVITVTQTGFGHSLREAVSDSITLASDMVLFFARFVIMMVPVFLFVFVPLGLLGRYLVRRAKRMRLAQALATSGSE